MNPQFRLFVILSFFIITLFSCIDFCTEEYELIVPVSVYPIKSEFKKGDTIHFQVMMDRTMVYDSLNRKSFNIPTFNPFLQIQNVVIDDWPTKDDLDTSFIVCNSKYNYIYYSALQSFGIRVDTPFIQQDSIIIKGSMVLKQLGTHMIYFDSPIGLLKDGRSNGFPFEGKCPDSFTDAYLPLLHENNESILSEKNKEVIDKHFEKVEGVRYRSAKFYYNVVE
jgi:hypothetical protein